MTAMMSAATSLPPGYYRAFESRSRAVAADASPPSGESDPDAQEQILEEARKETSALQSLTQGWNGYDAVPPTAESIRQAMRWLRRSYAECKVAGVRWYKPNVTASAEGEVVFEWWASDRSLIVYVEGQEVTFHKSWDVAGKTQHEHGEALLGSDQAKLLDWFGE